MNFAFLCLLCLFVSCFCSNKNATRREQLKKKLDESIPILEYLLPVIPESLQQAEQEFERLLLGTIEEVNGLIKFCKNDPNLAYSHSSNVYGTKSVCVFAQFYLALRLAQVSLKMIHCIMQNLTSSEDQMSSIFPIMRFFQHSLSANLTDCTSLPAIVTPYSTNNFVLASSNIDSQGSEFVIVETLMSEKRNKQKNLFIQTNSDNLLHRVNWLNVLLVSYFSYIVRQEPTLMKAAFQVNHFRHLFSEEELLTTTQVVISFDRNSQITSTCTSFSLLHLFIFYSQKNARFFSSDPAVVLNFVESLAKNAKEDTGQHFFDRFHSIELLKFISDTPFLTGSFAQQAKDRLALLEEISRQDRLILLLNSSNNVEKGRGTKKIQAASSKRKNRQGANRKKYSEDENSKKIERKKEIVFSNFNFEEEAIVAEQIEKLNNFVTLPIDIHFIRFGQYCHDNVLDQVLRNIPNNYNYTWTMVADYCTTTEGQYLLYELGLTLRDINDCIQVVRNRAEKAHPTGFTIDQVQQEDIPALLAYHRNFSPLKHLLEYLNSISEWQKVLGGSLPIVDNDEEENLATADALLMAAIRAGELCLKNVFEPAAIALKLNPMQSSMTDIIQIAEKYSVIETPNGSKITLNLLKDCRAVYHLRNKYAHQNVTKEQATASEAKAYGNRYAEMTILKPEFECKTTSGQFY